MINPEQYWILHGVDSFGYYQSREILSARTFFLEQFGRVIRENIIKEAEIQTKLFNYYRDDSSQDKISAKLCLRCFVSNCIYQFCWSTEKKYRSYYNLKLNDLLPVVLDLITS